MNEKTGDAELMTAGLALCAALRHGPPALRFPWDPLNFYGPQGLKDRSPTQDHQGFLRLAPPPHGTETED